MVACNNLYISLLVSWSWRCLLTTLYCEFLAYDVLELSTGLFVETPAWSFFVGGEGEKRRDPLFVGIWCDSPAFLRLLLFV